MRIEVNRHYKTRDGHSAIVERLSGSNVYPFEGRVEQEEEDPLYRVLWTAEGRYINKNNDDEYDLVRELK